MQIKIGTRLILVNSIIMFIGLSVFAPLLTDADFHCLLLFTLLCIVANLMLIPAALRWVCLADLNAIQNVIGGIKRGDYDIELEAAPEPNDPEEEYELNRLKREINWMRRAIAMREEDIRHQTRQILALNETLRIETITDKLTGLYNGRFFWERIGDCFNDHQRTGEPFAFTIMDIDFFKRVNDTYGHLNGDRVLEQFALTLRKNTRKTDVAALEKAGHSRQQVAVLCIDLDNFRAINNSKDHAVGDSLLTLAARRLSDAIRQNDTVSRIGGDEFLVVSPVPRQAFVSALAERLLATLNRPFYLNNLDFFITASIGIAISPTDGTTPEQLLKNAEIAMYQAKHAGRNCFRRYKRGQNERLVRQVAIERELHAALRKRSFPVHYQPIVDPARGEIVGMEALVRWRRPDGSLVPPESFIPVAEETGLIRELGYQVLEQACCDTMAFHAAGFPRLRVSVNISAVQFQDRELAPKVLRILQKTGLLATCLNLEITESTLMADLDAAEHNLRRPAGTTH
jgi:diguanylate cyclase (GGDEF)-like protein